MANWFAVFSLNNILVFAIGWLLGRFHKLIKKTFKFAKNELNGENKEKKI
jgi:hypothetical protein